MRLKKWEELPSELQTEEVRRYYDILKKKNSSLFFKRIFDIIISFTLLLLFSPLFLILAAAIKLYTPPTLLCALLLGYRAARSLPRPCVSLGRLAPYRQTLSVADAPVTADFHKSFDVERNFAAEFAFYSVIVIDILSELGYRRFVEILNPRVGVYARCGKDLLRGSKSYTVYIGKAYFYSFLSG